MSVKSHFILPALLAILAGCMSSGTQPLLTSAYVAGVPASEIAGNHAIFVATSRSKAEDPNVVFAGNRSDNLNYVRVNVTVPKVHKAGNIERRKDKEPADPLKYFTASEVVAFRNSPQFVQTLSADVAARGGRALIFVHGYNTSFDSAVYRMTQIVHDSGYTGTPVLFSWASGAKTRDYIYDKESASAARDQLEQLLRIVSNSGARRVDIIAHSMGTWITMEALRQLAITNNRTLGGKLGDVVLASPDIDVDVFKSQMRRYGKPDKPFIVLLSADDRALKMSGILSGSRPRVGDYKDAASLAEYGVEVVDLSDAKSRDRFNHTKFADNPAMVRLLGQRLREDDGYASDRDVTDRIRLLHRGLM